MYSYGIKSNLIKWWQITYDPTVRKVFPTKAEQQIFEEEEAARLEAKRQEELKHNQNYNASTGSMSGEYGSHAMDDETKSQLDSILKSNYTALGGIDSLHLDMPEKEMSSEEKKIAKLCDVSNLSPEEAAAKQEQIKRANEIYERLLQEAKEDEQIRQNEIEAAKIASA